MCIEVETDPGDPSTGRESVGQRKGLAMLVLSSPENCNVAGSRHGQERCIPL